MFKAKRMIFWLMILMTITGCSANKETINNFEDSFKKIESSIIGPADWGAAEIEVNKFKKQYNKALWKMQLLATHNEYGSIKHEINKLKSAIKSQDKISTNLHMATIKSYLSTIFNYNPDNPPKNKDKNKGKQ